MLKYFSARLIMLMGCCFLFKKQSFDTEKLLQLSMTVSALLLVAAGERFKKHGLGFTHHFSFFKEFLASSPTCKMLQSSIKKAASVLLQEVFETVNLLI